MIHAPPPPWQRHAEDRPVPGPGVDGQRHGAAEPGCGGRRPSSRPDDAARPAGGEYRRPGPARRARDPRTRGAVRRGGRAERELPERRLGPRPRQRDPPREPGARARYSSDAPAVRQAPAVPHRGGARGGARARRDREAGGRRRTDGVEHPPGPGPAPVRRAWRAFRPRPARGDVGVRSSGPRGDGYGDADQRERRDPHAGGRVRGDRGGGDHRAGLHGARLRRSGAGWGAHDGARAGAPEPPDRTLRAHGDRLSRAVVWLAQVSVPVQDDAIPNGTEHPEVGLAQRATRADRGTRRGAGLVRGHARGGRQAVRRRGRRRRRRPRGPRGRVLLDARPVGLGQDDLPADDRRVRAARRRAGSCSTARTSPASPPYERDVNTVFQDYALFPHMTVAENVAYGLKVKKVADGRAARPRGRGARDGAARRRSASRKPAQLSGGQRQRVALARALVNRPKVLLLDEPLGALDLKLRQAMQIELKEIQQQVGLTFIYVTHDQEEALTMSDRLAVFNRGQDRAGRHAGRGLRAAGDRVRGRVRRDLERPGGRGGAGDRRRPARVHVRPEKIAMVEPDARGPGRRLHRHRARARGRLPGRAHPVHRRRWTSGASWS